ncbi:MAG: response regulator transcription factor [Lachnospiraceae bacterium]|nr:response regulator transcription factor [Lachnospiraceae bacterium]
MVVGICDDEEAVREDLRKRVLGSMSRAEIFSFASGEELLKCGANFDILFLDIQMPGRNGMDVARDFRREHEQCILIFVTGVEEYVFQAFDVGAFHYLVKPFSEKKFLQVLERAVETKRQRQVEEDRAFVVNAGGSHRRVLFRDIVYAEVFNRKVVIHTLSDTVEYYGKLRDLEREAGEGFFRTHRSYLVNLRHVTKYDMANVYLGKVGVLLSKANYPDFVRALLKCAGKNERQ